jgi:hypothetical protein
MEHESYLRARYYGTLLAVAERDGNSKAAHETITDFTQLVCQLGPHEIHEVTQQFFRQYFRITGKVSSVRSYTHHIPLAELRSDNREHWVYCYQCVLETEPANSITEALYNGVVHLGAWHSENSQDNTADVPRNPMERLGNSTGSNSGDVEYSIERVPSGGGWEIDAGYAEPECAD